MKHDYLSEELPEELQDFEKSNYRNNSFDLLRPFDPTQVINGAKVCTKDYNVNIKYITGPNALGYVVIQYATCRGEYDIIEQSKLRLAPLSWKDGKPIYWGDIIYYRNSEFKIISYNENTNEFTISDSACKFEVSFADISLERKKKILHTAWINIFRNEDGDVRLSKYPYTTKEEAIDAISSSYLENKRFYIDSVKLEWYE